MSKVTVETIRSILKSRTTFETCLKKLQIISASNGSCVAELKVEQEHSNSNPVPSLHGGLAATLVDSVSGWGLSTLENVQLLPTVSIGINMTYIKAAPVGEEIVIESNTIRAGKTIAFLEIVIKSKKNGETLVRGTHTKFIMQPRK